MACNVLNLVYCLVWSRFKDFITLSIYKLVYYGIFIFYHLILELTFYVFLLLIQLLIPGCTGLTPEGVIRAVKTLSQQGHTLKSLWINGVYNVQKHHLETLHSYLQILTSEHRPMSFLSHGNTNFLRLTHHIDLPPIDVQICPRCDEPRMVFDCPRKSCQIKKEGSTGMECRGCSLCIPRCAECGGCFDAFGEIEETVCGDDLCSNCWLHLPKCSYCNKPYCKRHAEENSHFTSGSTGFVCDACHEKFIELYYSDDEWWFMVKPV